MGTRKSGDFIESVSDFWLGMAGAAAHGFGEMTKRIQDRKEKTGERDLVGDFTMGMKETFDRAKEVVDRAVQDLKPVDERGVVAEGDGEAGSDGASGTRRQTAFEQPAVDQHNVQRNVR
jgi:hypothetical protein